MTGLYYSLHLDCSLTCHSLMHDASAEHTELTTHCTTTSSLSGDVLFPTSALQVYLTCLSSWSLPAYSYIHSSQLASLCHSWGLLVTSYILKNFKSLSIPSQSYWSLRYCFTFQLTLDNSNWLRLLKLPAPLGGQSQLQINHILRCLSILFWRFCNKIYTLTQWDKQISSSIIIHKIQKGQWNFLFRNRTLVYRYSTCLSLTVQK